ncbi:MAG: hypothetical protein ABSG68_22965, partial [Thermoguttaceae bacterium]
MGRKTNMAIEFRCSQCNTLLSVGDEAAGRQAKCPQCGAVATVPSVPAAPSAPDLSPADSPFALSGPSPFGADSENPYQSPTHAGDVPVTFELGRGAALQRVSGPATGLLVTGWLSLVLQLLGMIANMASIAFQQAGPARNAPQMPGIP